MFKRSHFGGGLFAYEATMPNGNVAVWYPDGAFEDGDGVTAELLTFAKEDATYEHPLTRRHCRSLEDAHLLINPPKFRSAMKDCQTCEGKGHLPYDEDHVAIPTGVSTGCDWCCEEIEEGHSCYVGDGELICTSCASEAYECTDCGGVGKLNEGSETCDTCGDWIEIHAGLPVCKSGCAQGSNQ